MTAVVVTGASRGLGRAIALAFAADGARVVLVARSAEPLEAVAAEVRAAGGEPVVVAADVTVPAALSGLDETPDAVAAAAGVPGPTGPLWELAPGDWDATLRAQGPGAEAAFRAAAPLARFATPEDVAGAVRFLCSDAAVAITGEDLNLSAGTVTYG